MASEPVENGDSGVKGAPSGHHDGEDPPPRAAASSVQDDVLQVIPRRPGREASPADAASSSLGESPQDMSLAPMGLDSMPRLPGDPDATTGSVSVSLLSRRKRLTRIVVGAIAACGMILVAAGIAQAVRRSGDTTVAAAAPVSSTEAAPAPMPPEAPPAPEPAALEARTTGTVRIERPAAVGRVWLDGKKLTAVSTVVSCGKHQLRVGTKVARARSLDVPCGGEVRVSK